MAILLSLMVRAAFSCRLTKAIMSLNCIYLQEELDCRYYQRDPTLALPSGACDRQLQDRMSLSKKTCVHVVLGRLP